ncbi:MAG: tRNA lysidine(34) synthetase TilS [Bacteroidetes bacterium]|nr:tRNA lysidine(34) synthetase TilS [Bacteroidota bacterium]
MTLKLPASYNHANTNYLLAVSGGMDSMVMAELFLKQKLQFSVAHCNFQLRGEESDLDEALVRDWCLKHDIIFYGKKFKTLAYAEEHKLSIQVAARELRYTFFNELLHEHQLDCVATAHHRDDNIETMLFHFFRGTGIQGLSGIPASSAKLVRPMLPYSREEIQAYAQQNAIEYRSDASNFKTEYTRNKIRLEVIPALEAIFPSLKNNLNHNIERLHDANEIYIRTIENYRKKLVEVRGKDFFIPIRKLKNQDPLQTIVYELVKPFGFSFEQSIQVISLMQSQTGAYIESSTHKLFRNREFFLITERRSEHSEMLEISKEDQCIQAADFSLELNSYNKPIPNKISNSEAFIHEALLEFPLLLRKWRQGDYLYPFGMTKKKKVARVLIDLKLPLHEKENVWVLESNKKIVWILGIRSDNRFRVDEHTQSILHIQMRIV